MSSANTFAALVRLLPGSPLLYGTVASTDGTSSVIDLPQGGQVTVRGTRPIGQPVFYQSGAITSDAPALDLVIVEL